MSLEGFLKYPLVFLASFGVTYILVPLVKRLAISYGMVDLPEERRLNDHPVPRGGGLAVYIGFLAACSLIFCFPWQLKFNGTLDARWWSAYLVGSAVLVIVGLIDDGFDLRWSAKLCGQVIAAVILFQGGVSVGRIQGFELPAPLDFFCTLAWFLALTNAFNLIDGLDGLAAGLSLIAAFGLSAAAMFRALPADALVLLALAGAALAFLRYNFHPASIFLGDSGSMFLGYTLAAIALPSGAKGPTIAAIGVPLLAAGVPLFDTLLALWRRSVRAMTADRRSKGIMRADMEHLHHRLMQAGLSQRQVALWLYNISLLLVLIGLLSLVYNSQALGILLVALVIGSYLTVRHLARVELWDSGVAFLRGIKRPTRPTLATLLYPLFDGLVLASALTAGMLLTAAPGDLHNFRRAWMNALPAWCGVPFIALFLSGIYNRVWSRARISEFLILALAVFSGFALSLGIALITDGSQPSRLTLQAITGLAVAGPTILGLRALPRTILDLMGVFQEPNHANLGGAAKILIYGAGYHGILYLKQRTFSSYKKSNHSQVAGFIDDDHNLRKRLVHGYPVLGTSAELPETAAALEISEVVIACRLSQEKKTKLLQFAKLHDLTVKEWRTSENVLYAAETQFSGLAPQKAAHA